MHFKKPIVTPSLKVTTIIFSNKAETPQHQIADALIFIFYKARPVLL